MTFQPAVFSVTRWPPQRPVQRCSAAAMTCGMPLPAASGAKRRVSQAPAAKPTGRSSSVASGQACHSRS